MPRGALLGCYLGEAFLQPQPALRRSLWSTDDGGWQAGRLGQCQADFSGGDLLGILENWHSGILARYDQSIPVHFLLFSSHRLYNSVLSVFKSPEL